MARWRSWWQRTIITSPSPALAPRTDLADFPCRATKNHNVIVIIIYIGSKRRMVRLRNKLKHPMCPPRRSSRNLLFV